jgi:tetratricopeptide (TPR) repeat protein
VKIQIALASMLAGSAAIPAAAQQAAPNSRVMAALPTRYVPPECELKPGHFKVSSGATYLKTGIETEIPDNRSRALASGSKVILEAIQKNGQEKNPAAWYYLGRIYLQQGDLAGADSSFSKAESLSPACKADISKVRSTGWIPLVNAGVEFAKKQQNDSALALFRQANSIYRDKPAAFLNAGVIFANANQTDSAIVYWEKAAEIAERINATEDRNVATRNLGAMYQRANRHEDGVRTLERYLGWVPNDTEVKRALATSYRATGQTEKAVALEKEVGAAPAAPAGPASVAGGAASAMNSAISLYNAKKYQEAAAAFEKVVASEPYNRDALFGLANSYIGLKNGPKLAETAARLVEIEPMNDEIVRMLANGQRMAKKETAANKTATQVLGMPLTVSITQFAPTASGAGLTGTATGREAQTSTGKPITAKPVTLIVEFIDTKGTVIANQEVQIPALKPGQSQPIEAKAEGAGITAWRYKKM